jgi:ribosomal-protein-alanine N-acetyltransferase
VTDSGRPTLTTDRLVLRPFEIGDAPEVRRLAGDPRVAATTVHIPHPYEEGMAEAWIGTHAEEFEEGRGLTLAITLRGPGALAGAIGLVRNRRFENAEAGYWIGVPYWNAGYATEALSAVLDHAFGTMGLHRVHAHHMQGNAASGRVMEKVGMRREGVLREHVKAGTQFLDAVLYGILQDEWARDRTA